MTPAKRGMLLVVERRHTSTTLHGATTESVDYAPGIVASTRGGIALAYIDSNGVRIPLGTVTHPRWWVVSEIHKGRDVTGHIPTSYEDLDAARNAIRPFLGCARSYQGE